MYRTLRRILVPVDFTDCSHAALDYALFLARPFGAEVEAIHVWNARTDSWDDGRSVALFSQSPMNFASPEYMELADRSGGIRVRARVEFGKLYETLVAIVSEEEFDLVVVGVHGRRRIAHLFNGHMADRLARDLDCPVIAVRGSREPEVPDEAFSNSWSFEASRV